MTSTRTLALVLGAMAVLVAGTVLADTIAVPNGNFGAATVTTSGVLPTTDANNSGGTYASAVATASSTNPGLYTAMFNNNDVANWNVSYSLTSYVDITQRASYDPYIRVQNTSAGSLPLDPNNSSSNWFGFNPGTLNQLPLNNTLLTGAPTTGGIYGGGVWGSWVNNYITNGSSALATAYAGQTPALTNGSAVASAPSALESVALTSASTLATIVGGNTYTASVDVGNFTGRNSPSYTIGFYDGANLVGTSVPTTYGNWTTASWKTITTSWTAPAGSNGDTLKIALLASGFDTAASANQAVFDNVTSSFTVGTPEPASMTILCTGLVGLLAYAWRRRRV